MINEKKDACYHKVKARYSVWPSAYASGALVKCRRKGAANWGNKSKKMREAIFSAYIDVADALLTEKMKSKSATKHRNYRPDSHPEDKVRRGVVPLTARDCSPSRTGRLAASNKRKAKAGRPAPSPHDLGEAKSPAWQRSEGKNPKGGLNAKGVASYRAANPGSKLKTAVTTKPSKLKKGSKSAKRRKSFCARMGGMKKRLTSSKTANDPDSRINKALRKWNC
jgi:hypothetical protein